MEERGDEGAVCRKIGFQNDGSYRLNVNVLILTNQNLQMEQGQN